MAGEREEGRREEAPSHAKLYGIMGIISFRVIT